MGTDVTPSRKENDENSSTEKLATANNEQRGGKKVIEKFPEGTLIEVTFEVRIPVAATEDQINEWLPYVVCKRGGCSGGNPLVNHGVNDWNYSLDWSDTGMLGQREESHHWSKPDGSHGCTVHHRRIRRVA